MKYAVAIFLTLTLTGCGGSAAALLEAVSLDACEIGTVEFRGVIDVSSNPFVTTNVYVNMNEVHTAETIPADCPGFKPIADVE